MSHWQEIAAQRAQNDDLPYDGALTPTEAQTVFLAREAVIVDVRTQAERDFVGFVPDTYHIAWIEYPSWTQNPHFAAELRRQIPAHMPVLFLCRSGHRSHDAAALAHRLGYYACNILYGFEGDLDPATHQRNRCNGWRHERCSWIQS